MRRLTPSIYAGLIAACVFSFASSVKAAPEVDVHDLTWFVHVDLIDPGAGEDLTYWTGVIQDVVDRANNLLIGRNGPADQVCCTQMTNSVAVSTFGTPGDGLDVVDSVADQNSIAATGLPGSRAFLVDSLTYCNGTSPDAIGCALRPSCSGNANDDPNLWMYVAAESLDDGTLPSVIAHERGHNSCLQHVSAAKCQLMQGTVFTPGLGGCVTATECTNFRNARTETSSGLTCGCHDDFEAPLADGSVCAAGNVCSGGRCGSITGDAGVHLVAAADPGDAGLLIPDDAIRVSALTGDWTNLGQMSPTADDVKGMAYAHDSATLYGVVPTVFDDSIVTMDASTGAILSVVGSIANGAEEIVSMGYDPGATSGTGDDRLIVLEVDGDSGEFRAIDPATPSTATLLGGMVWQPAGLFTGMAYDSVQDKLFLATPFGANGLWETDLTSCPPSPCTTTQLSGSGLFMDNASLAFAKESGMLYLVGTSFSGSFTRTFYNVIDPVSGTSVETLSLDRFTPAGLAAVPEPGLVMGITAGVAMLALNARRRRTSRSSRRP